MRGRCCSSVECNNITRVIQTLRREVRVENIIRQVEHLQLYRLPGVGLHLGLLVDLDVPVGGDEGEGLLRLGLADVDVPEEVEGVLPLPLYHLVPHAIRLLVLDRRGKLDGKKRSGVFVISYFTGVHVFWIIESLYKFLFSLSWRWSVTAEGVCLDDSDRGD